MRECLLRSKTKAESGQILSTSLRLNTIDKISKNILYTKHIYIIVLVYRFGSNL